MLALKALCIAVLISSTLCGPPQINVRARTSQGEWPDRNYDQSIMAAEASFRANLQEGIHARAGVHAANTAHSDDSGMFSYHYGAGKAGAKCKLF